MTWNFPPTQTLIMRCIFNVLANFFEFIEWLTKNIENIIFSCGYGRYVITCENIGFFTHYIRLLLWYFPIYFTSHYYTNISKTIPLFTLIKPLSPKLLPHEFLINQYGIPLSVPQPIAKTAWLIVFGGALKNNFTKSNIQLLYIY